MSTHTGTTCFYGEIRKIGVVLLMSTQNICFHGEIRKNGKTLLMSTHNILVCFHF